MPTKRPFPVDPTLTAIAIGYRNPAATLIAKQALPPLMVLSEQFKWTTFPLAEGFTLPDTRVGRKGRVNQVEFTASEESSFVQDYGLDDALPQSDIDAAARARAERRSNVDPRAMAVEGLTNLIELDREVRVANVVQDSANFAAGRKITLADPEDQFDDYENSDPYGVIDDGMNGTLIYRPNHIVMGQPVWARLKRHPRLIKAVKGGLTEDGAITRQQFADLFEIPVANLLIGEAFLNTAKKGQDVTLQRVWGKSIQLLYLDPGKQSATDNKITWGFTAEYGTRVSGAIDDPDIGLRGGERVRVGEQTRELVCAKDVGYQIIDAVS
jgi:hypothetical protein